MGALGGAVQEGVERGDAVDLDGVDVEGVGDDLHGVVVDAVVAALDLREDGDEGAAAGTELLDELVELGPQLLLLRDAIMPWSPPSRGASRTLATSVAGSTGLGWNSSTGTISSSLSMLRPIAALTLVSIRIGRVWPFLRSSRAMFRPSSGSSIITSRMSRSGLVASSRAQPVGAVRGALDLVALSLEDELAGLDDVGVVVDDQDPGHGTLPLSLAFPHGTAPVREPPRPCHSGSRCFDCPALARLVQAVTSSA